MKPIMIYLAGKVPKSDEELKNYSDWRKEFEIAVKKDTGCGIICLDPSHVHFDIADIYGVFGRDVYMVKQSDFIVIDARERIGPGTAQEMLIAKYFKKPVVTILPKNSHYWKDTKIRDKEAKAWMNPFIAATSDIIAESVEDAAKKIAGCIKNNENACAKSITLLDDAIKYYTSNILQKDISTKGLHEKLTHPKIIIASKSRGRERVLREAGFDFEVMPSNMDESKISDKNPEMLVKRLALAKAEDVASKLDESRVIIGADTICIFNGKVIGKPKDRKDALEMLEAFSGKTHMILTGIAVVCRKSKKAISDVSVSTVTFRKITRAEIEDYLKLDDAYRFAGGYSIDGTKSAKFIEGISGSYSGVIGMPLEKLIPMLRRCGVDV